MKIFSVFILLKLKKSPKIYAIRVVQCYWYFYNIFSSFYSVAVQHSVFCILHSAGVKWLRRKKMTKLVLSSSGVLWQQQNVLSYWRTMTSLFYLRELCSWRLNSCLRICQRATRAGYCFCLQHYLFLDTGCISYICSPASLIGFQP